MEGNAFQLLSPSPQPATHLWILVKDCSIADDDDILIRRWDWQGGWSEWWTFPNFSARPPPSQSTASKRHFLFLSLPSHNFSLSASLLRSLQMCRQGSCMGEIQWSQKNPTFGKCVFLSESPTLIDFPRASWALILIFVQNFSNKGSKFWLCK